MSAEEERVSVLERPTGYWQSNIVAGRRRVVAAITRRLAPLEGLSIADLCCDDDRVVSHLVARGAHAFAVEGALPAPATRTTDVLLVREVVEERSERDGRRVQACLQSPARAHRLFDALPPPGVPHEVTNLSDSEPVMAVVARSDASEWERIIPYDRESDA